MAKAIECHFEDWVTKQHNLLPVSMLSLAGCLSCVLLAYLHEARYHALSIAMEGQCGKELGKAFIPYKELGSQSNRLQETKSWQ